MQISLSLLHCFVTLPCIIDTDTPFGTTTVGPTQQFMSTGNLALSKTFTQSF